MRINLLVVKNMARGFPTNPRLEITNFEFILFYTQSYKMFDFINDSYVYIYTYTYKKNDGIERIRFLFF